MTLRRISVALGLSFLATNAAADTAVKQLNLPQAGEETRWQAVASNTAQTLWLGSTTGHVAYSEDGGDSWTLSQPVGRNGTLPITQIKAKGDREAYVLTSGRGSDSRLYHSRNSGYSWNQLHRADGDRTLRCFDHDSDGETWILGSGRSEEWHAVRSTNGRTWLSARSGFNQPAQANESGFNESGSCVRYANNTWAMGSAYANQARLMYKSNTGLRFRVVATPISGAEGAAVTSVWPLGNDDILFTGGLTGADTETDNDASRVFRYHNNEFSNLPVPPLSGVLTSLTTYQDYILVGNATGVAWSADWGQNWEVIDTPARQLSCTFEQGCYAIGQNGLVHFDPAR
ncbi:hypothetical protein CWE12_04555 [Aliidiomarina sedimenti]|uniref:Glycosyl hydrolase n=1 Tax=Aliidiomarina sedimenti TaxID=1933879 RepID=A0ABY0C367_9GAMM|nr:hypothetical protein [Aliidiomarina sedimenti]RUO32251.1 hypothetical protein CWE12_04555 [Aliidiomarina sedimenti]